MKPTAFIISLLMGLALGQAQAEVDASRIASVDANATEILLSLGLADHLVALDMTSLPLLPETNLPNLGYHRALSTEGLLSTEPTLIIGSTHMGPAPVVEMIQSTDIELLQLSPATSVDELVNNITMLGDVLAEEANAEQLVDLIHQQHDAIAAAQQGDSLSMVFLLDMTGRGLSKAGEGTTGASLVTLLGGDNLVEYSGYKTISMEAILELDPDVILVGSNEPGIDAAARLLADNPLLQHSRAVSSHRLLSVDASLMVAGVSPGVLTEAQRLSQQIYR